MNIDPAALMSCILQFGDMVANYIRVSRPKEGKERGVEGEIRTVVRDR